MGNKNKFKKKRIRPVALCVFLRDGKIFVAEGYDKILQQTFYRPLGGKIEFGERGSDTIIRELKEEIDAEVADVTYLGTLENIFTYENQPGHEIALIYTGRFPDESLNQDNIVVEGIDDDTPLFTATWKPLSVFQQENAPPLYPTDLLALIEKNTIS